MDDSGEIWLRHGWKDKIAAGFTNSHSYSGDKLNVLLQLAVFAAQHGMVWIGVGDMPSGSTPDDINRLGSFMGVMTQSDTSIVIDAPSSGDRRDGVQSGATRGGIGCKTQITPFPLRGEGLSAAASC